MVGVERQIATERHFKKSHHGEHGRAETANLDGCVWKSSSEPQPLAPHGLVALLLSQPLGSVAVANNHRNVAAAKPRPVQIESCAACEARRLFKFSIPSSSRRDLTPATLPDNCPYLYYHHTDESPLKMTASWRLSLW